MAENNFLMMISIIAVVAIVAVFGMVSITGNALGLPEGKACMQCVELGGYAQKGSTNLNECILYAKAKQVQCIRAGWEDAICMYGLDRDMNQCYELYSNGGSGNCNLYDGTTCSTCQNGDNDGCCWNSAAQDCYAADACIEVCMLDQLVDRL